MKASLVFVLLAIGCQHLSAQQVYPLYGDKIPPSTLGTLDEKNRPFITAYLPVKSAQKNMAIIIFPGGGYRTLVTQTEGEPIAEAFAKKGIAAFVLHYRLPDDRLMVNKHIVPLMDAQQALLWVKTHHDELGVDTARVGVIGYSAGGHLAAMTGTHFSSVWVPNPGQVSLRPAFMALVYPVISMEPNLAHMGSRQALLGLSPSPEQIHFFSAEQHVGKDTPPTYIIHSVSDSVVSVNNSLVLFDALSNHGVNAELHLVSHGNHGFVHSFKVDDWVNPILSWLSRKGF